MKIAYQRNGEWLELPIASLNSCNHDVPAELHLPLRAGSHPHEVRKRLLALRLFPDKWVNRLFSVGGIRVEENTVLLHAFKPADVAKNAMYRLAQQRRQQGFKDGGEQPAVLYEDDWCIVFNKPAGMPVHPNGPDHRGTLDEAAALHCLLQDDPLPVKHIHRLDDDTAGPVLYAKHELAQLILDEAMRSKKVERYYEAIVEGKLKRPKGTIQAPIGKDRHHGSRRRVTPAGDPAVTHYYTEALYRDASLVKLRLETGRTHQIRVHMSYMGYPLVGDKLYGGSGRLLSHQALRGERLEFVHPLSGETVTVIAPEPPWFTILKEKLSRL
ncbi:RluA family pseudouridine synthase [Paenibacillus sp. GCM10027626]|uniref:RluA family pseudouridine synthase n=1 Tax=Paenibacillus sp. GCM10027626 TaxID=3273411 RepID=UPI0036348BBB